ncbi:MAG: phosphatase PAP2 family protein [Paludibacteraceae bacterium]|nr:phosphatase PAP2 family protein [Paludibacteraceae bacterium]
MLKLDTEILLWINGHHAEWLDWLMWHISRSATWIPLYVLLVGLIVYRYRSHWKTIVLILVGFGIAVGLSDYTCSGILKPLVCRFRPTHEPALTGLLHIVCGYTGGLYGFCSSHAANTMACALLFSLIWRNKYATTGLMTWVALNCYSRMYLGVHYPTDIVCGLLIGSVWSVLVFVLLRHPALTSCSLRADDEATRQSGS